MRTVEGTSFHSGCVSFFLTWALLRHYASSPLRVLWRVGGSALANGRYKVLSLLTQSRASGRVAGDRLRRLSVAAPVSLALLFVTADPGACLDHFKCYKTRDMSSPLFAPRTVTLADQFGTTNASVVRPLRLCNPTDKNGEGIGDPTAHLMCYSIREPSASYPTVLARNQFGDQTVIILGTE